MTVLRIAFGAAAILCGLGAVATRRLDMLAMVIAVTLGTWYWRPTALAVSRDRSDPSKLDGLLLWLALALVPTLLWWLSS